MTTNTLKDLIPEIIDAATRSFDPEYVLTEHHIAMKDWIEENNLDVNNPEHEIIIKQKIEELLYLVTKSKKKKKKEKGKK